MIQKRDAACKDVIQYMPKARVTRLSSATIEDNTSFPNFGADFVETINTTMNEPLSRSALAHSSNTADS
jgi:hypothetical protein